MSSVKTPEEYIQGFPHTELPVIDSKLDYHAIKQIHKKIAANAATTKCFHCEREKKCEKEGSGLLVLLCLLAYVRAYVLCWRTYSRASCVLVRSCSRLYLCLPENGGWHHLFSTHSVCSCLGVSVAVRAVGNSTK